MRLGKTSLFFQENELLIFQFGGVCYRPFWAKKKSGEFFAIKWKTAIKQKTTNTMTELFNNIAEQLLKGEITREQAVRLFEAASAPAKKTRKTKKQIQEEEERADSKTGRTIAEVVADMRK